MRMVPSVVVSAAACRLSVQRLPLSYIKHNLFSVLFGFAGHDRPVALLEQHSWCCLSLPSDVGPQLNDSSETGLGPVALVTANQNHSAMIWSQ